MTNLYVGNLSYDANEDDLRSYFGSAGEVGAVKIINDRETGKPRGFAFVEVSDATKAIEEFNDRDFMGRRLNISVARPKEKRSSGSSSDYGSRSYGGGGSRGGYRDR